MPTQVFSPGYRQISEILRNLIAQGEYSPGGRIDSSRTLAERFGVARMTVRKAVSELVEAGILVRGRGRQGTFVVESPPLSAGRESSVDAQIGLCFLDLYQSTHPYFARLTRGLADYCSQRSSPFAVYLIHASDIFFRRDVPLVRALGQNRIRGLLLAGNMTIEDIYALRNQRIPHVWINHELGGEVIPATLVDYADGAFSAVEHLLTLGHRRIALLLGNPRNRASYLSLTGYKLGLRLKNVEFDPDIIIQGSFEEKSGYQMAQEVLGRRPRPTAIFAVDDLIACGAIKAVQEAGLRIPEDVSIVGYGNLASPYATSPSLTTLEIHLEKMAVAAAELLERICSGTAIDEVQPVFRPELIVRQSTGPVRG